MITGPGAIEVAETGPGGIERDTHGPCLYFLVPGYYGTIERGTKIS